MSMRPGIAVVVLFGVAACGGATTSRVCAAGTAAPCSCADGSAGARTCNADGSGFGACLCAMVDAGFMPDATSDSGAPPVCTPGVSRTCTCGGGAGGTQVCLADGSGYDTCSSCMCPTGEHLCGATCSSNMSTSSCGTSCSPCAAPADATASCDGTSCAYACAGSYTMCGTSCVDTTTDAANCGACGTVCAGGGTCVAGTCHGGLFGACGVDSDCAAAGAAAVCLDNVGSHGFAGFPHGLCTRPCATSAECGATGACVSYGSAGGYCMQACIHGASCRDGYNCYPHDPGGPSVCERLCDSDAECGTGSYCNTWSGRCQGTPLGASPPGAVNGAPCGIFPDGTSNCRGACQPPWSDAAGVRTPTGFAAGQCFSRCDVPPGSGVDHYLAASCSAATVCVPTASPVIVGDVGHCLPECHADADCAEGYACDVPTTSGAHWTNGFCAPIDCGDGVHVCPGNYYCQLGYDSARPAAGRCHASNIEHVVLIVQENHTFDAYFGRYCTAPAYSDPTCTTGPACCEAAPPYDTPTDGTLPYNLTDAENASYLGVSGYNDRNHDFTCELCELDTPAYAMDHFTDGTCTGAATVAAYACSNPHNWVTGFAPTMSTYWSYADSGALADRYFQPIAGGTSSNDMYFATASYWFLDNAYEPNSIGRGCTIPVGDTATPALFTGTTIADLLLDAGRSFTAYADGYAEAVAAAPSCPFAAADCPYGVYPATGTCKYDPSDVPFEFFSPRFTDNPAYMRDYGRDFGADVAAGRLPDFSYVKFRVYRNEHPGFGTITRGETSVDEVVTAIETSPVYAGNTLIILTWDEGGGFFDHVVPPAPVENFPPGDPYDGYAVPYGARVPMLAIGPVARAGTVSHVAMEHSSLVRFLEFNFLGPARQGALGHRDAVVNNIGSMLDPVAVGVAVP